MITKRKLVIPIFEYKLTICIYDKWDEVKQYASDSNKRALGITVITDGAALLAVQSDKQSTVVHECEHVKNAIWDYIGYHPLPGNDEVDAYLITFIYENVKQVFDKHNKNSVSN